MGVVVEQVKEDLLKRLVAQRDEATVLLAGSNRELPARFEAVDETAVTFLMYVAPSQRTETGQVACVQYHREGHPSVFMTSVLTTVEESDGTFLSLRRPDRLAQVEARRAFRVPFEAGDLPVQLVGPEGRCSGEVRDLSPLGVGITATEGDLPEVDDSVRVRILVRGERRVLSGTVVRVAGTTVGIAFTADVPARIADVVTEAEARWRERHRG